MHRALIGSTVVVALLAGTLPFLHSVKRVASLPHHSASLAFEPAADGSHYLVRGPQSLVRLGPTGALIAGSKPQAAPAEVGLRFEGADTRAIGRGMQLLAGRTHYYVGNDPAAWRQNVPNYGRVEYADVYPGIDLVYRGEQGRLEFDLVVSPGADPQLIRLGFDGVKSQALDPAGDLTLATAQGDLTLDRPLAYQEIAGRRQPVAVAFRAGSDDVRFQLGPYDRSQPLVIDPVISFADYVGGTGDDTATSIAVDGNGNRYVTGSTSSPGIKINDSTTASKSPILATAGYVAKLAPNGDRTYLIIFGGNDTDLPYAIAVDGTGAVYVAGETYSANFPVTGGPYQPANAGNGDAFVAKFGPAGAPVYATYLGGAARDSGRAIAVDLNQNIYVGGFTFSSDYPVTAGAFQTILRASTNRSNGFVAKISTDGQQLVFSSFFGGTGSDNVNTVAVDEASSLYLAGNAQSSDLPTTANASQKTFAGGVQDGYLAKMTTDGSGLIYLTYFGGSAFDGILGMAVDASHNAYVTGFTSSNFDFPRTVGPLYGGCSPNDNSCTGGPFDAFVAKFDPTSTRLYSTLLGGDGDDEGLGIAVDGQGQVTVAGQTTSSNFPLVQPLQLQYLGNGAGSCGALRACNGFVTRLSADGTTRQFSTYYGGVGDDRITGVAVDGSVIQLAGIASSTNLPLVGAVQGSNQGGRDGFVAGIDTSAASLPSLSISVTADPTPTPQTQPLVFDVDVTNKGSADATGVMVAATGTNADQLRATGVNCAALATGVLCPVGDGHVAVGDTKRLEIQASPPSIGNASLTVTLVRADQSGISVDPAKNSSSFTKLVVDTSGSGGGLFWELLGLSAAVLVSRRRGACRA